jgi:hypothetical protein
MKNTPTTTTRIDPREPRFASAVTTAVLVAALLAGPAFGLPLLAIQAAAFAAGGLLGFRMHPYSWLFRRLLRPRLSPPTLLEDERPPRFAQSLGLTLLALAAIGSVTGLPALFILATALALAASALNAALDLCLGCELYLLASRLLDRPVLRRVEA